MTSINIQNSPFFSPHNWSIFSNLLLIKNVDVRGNYNLGQKVGDKFAKLNKIDFSMECFTAIFLRYFTEKRQNLALRLTAVYSLSIQAFQRFQAFLEISWFPKILSPKSFASS